MVPRRGLERVSEFYSEDILINLVLKHSSVQQPGFDFEVLDLVSQETEMSSSCQGVNNIIKK